MSSVQLGPDLGIESAAELKETLARHLPSPQPVVMEGPQVERVHSASLQLLGAFVRERSAAGLQTQFRDCAPPLHDAARILGLTHHLGLDGTSDPSKDTP